MKKILLFASALAGLFLAGSCQRESLEPVMSGNTVTYTVTVPDALATKGIGDDVSNVNTLHYEVYRTAAAETDTFTDADRLLYHKTATAQPDGTFKIDLELVNDQNFTVLFWAQVGETNEAYDVDDLTSVTIKTPIKANQVDYAAFSGRDFIKATEKLASKTVQLTRPVAQINLGTTKASLKAFDTPITISSSSMTVAGLSNTFNVAKKAASDAFTSTTVYNEQNVLADCLEVNGTKYVNAGMNYVGFASTVGTPVTVSYVINTTEGDIANTIENVPVKPNFRTNIIGNLITSKTDYTIELLNTWYTPEEVVEVFAVDTAEELQDAIDSIQDGAEGNIILEGDIDLNDLFASLTKAGAADSQSITIPAGVEFTIDLNGYTLTGVDETETSFGLITNKGNLTIVNSAEGKTGKIKLIATKDTGFNRYSSVISTQPGSILTVGAGVEIEHLGGTSMSYAIDVLTNGKGTSAVAVVDGATVQSPYRAIRQFLNGTEAVNSLTVKAGSVIKSTSGNKSIWMQDPSTNANTGSLVVEEGAELYGNVYISATAGSTEWPVSASVAASTLKNGSEVEISPKELVGYNVVLNDGVYVFEQSWSVDGDEYTIYTAAGLKWVAEQVNTMDYYINAPANILDNATVKLANDIDLNNVEWTPIGDYAFNRTAFRGVFDGQGYTISNFKITKQASRTEKVAECSYGLFGNLYGTVKNLKIDNAIVAPDGGRFAGALVGRLKEGALIDNCHVTNSRVTINHWQVGGIAGQVNDADIKNSSISNSTITGYACVGAISGFMMVAGEYHVENCEVNNCEIVQNGSFGDGYDSMFGLVAGQLNADGVVLNIKNFIEENNTIKGTASNVLVGDKKAGAKVYVDGYESVAEGVSMKDGEYYISNANGFVWVEAQTDSHFANKTIKLANDIDMAGVAVKPIRIWNPEDKTVFDGQNFTISNMTISNLSTDNQALFNGTLNIKNVKVDNANVTGRGYVGVLGGTLYGSIENCHVTNSTVYGNYWQVGGLVGQYDAGTISKSSISNSCITGPSAVGALVGIFNENAVKIEESSVNTCEICQNYSFGDDYDNYFAVAVGLKNVSSAQFTDNTLTNNKVKGADSELFYAE